MKIYIENLTFDTIIGILEKERVSPQKVIITCEIEYEYKEDVFINYAQVVKIIENSMKINQFLLIENALLSITEEIKSTFLYISSIKLKISKPDILDQCEVSVEQFRKY